jgi:hypothetical protein
MMISLKEYERLLRRDRQVLLVNDLDDETLEAIRTAQPSERSKALNYRRIIFPSPAKRGRGKIRRITCVMLNFSICVSGGPIAPRRPAGATIDTRNPLERHNGVIWSA